MSIVLTVVLIAFCVQGLVKFAVGFLVPYRTRINRIATYYRRDGRIISIYDSVTLVIVAALVILLFLTDMHDLSFITGLIVGISLSKSSSTASTNRSLASSHPNPMPRQGKSCRMRSKPNRGWPGEKSSS
jgi:hypothetical protein